jgi:hypothetical protein
MRITRKELAGEIRILNDKLIKLTQRMVGTDDAGASDTQTPPKALTDHQLLVELECINGRLKYLTGELGKEVGERHNSDFPQPRLQSFESGWTGGNPTARQPGD